MTRRRFLPSLLSAPLAAAPANRPPNLILILIDDMGWTDLGCFGSKFYESPNIDRMAAQGTRFTNAYAAAPVCSPTRASIMTGKYPARLGITNYLPGGHPLPHSRKIGAENSQELPLSEITIAEALKPKGYATASIGKWHLGPKPFWPEHQGFDRNIGGTNSGMPRSFFYPDWADNPPIKAKPGEYLTDYLTDQAVRFIEENRSKPFFLYLPHYAVHIPTEAKREMVEKYRRKAKAGHGHSDPVYAAMIESVDQSVGRILKTLDQYGLSSNTTLFFTSDNGGLSAPEWKLKPVTSNAPLREGKGHLYEGGIRVPMIAWGHGVKPGQVSDTPVCSTDFMPTLSALAGVKPPSGIDGVDNTALLNGSASSAERTLYWHYPHYSNQQGRPASAIRRGRWKLIEFHEDSHTELYDLSEDVGEQHDRSTAVPTVARELHADLRRWRASVNGRMPVDNPNYDPKRAGFGYWWQTTPVR